MAEGSTYGALDVSLPEFTARTRLYHQRPLGIGTPMVESLTGYIVRLADAHVVTPGALIFKELGRTVAAGGIGHEGRRRCYSTFAYEAHTLNGMTDRAEKWAVAIGAATGVESVRLLTMLPWKHVFSAQGLTRTKRAWCARCYRQWRTEGVETYEPLLWMLPMVSICPLHQQLLMTRCPHCGRDPHVVSCRSRPGHCSRCGGWLGVQTNEPADGGEAADWSHAGSIGEAVATLLARAPTLERPPSVELLTINLRACLDDLAGGNESLFLRAAGLGAKTVDGWLSGRMLPRLDSLLTICFRLGVAESGGTDLSENFNLTLTLSSNADACSSEEVDDGYAYLIADPSQSGYLVMGPALRALEQEHPRLPATFYLLYMGAINRWARVFDYQDALERNEMLRDWYEGDPDAEDIELPDIQSAIPTCLRKKALSTRGLRQLMNRIGSRDVLGWLEGVLALHEESNRCTAPDLDSSIRDQFYDSNPPLPVLLTVFEKHDGIEGAFDDEAQGMMEVSPEPNFILPLRTDDVDQMRDAFATLRCFCRTMALASELMKQLPGNAN